MRIETITIAGCLAVAGLLGVACLADGDLSVLLQRDTQVIQVSLDVYPQVTGTVAYQGPVLKEGEENWKSAHTYGGVAIRDLVEAIGGLAEDETVAVIATDGWYKVLPYEVICEETVAGTPILALARDSTEGEAWEDVPMLTFLPEDKRFSNEDMLEAFGPDLSHYYADHPATTGFMVKNVAYLVVNYDGGPLPSSTEEGEADAASAFASAKGVVLTVEKASTTSSYTIADLEQLDLITSPGTFTNSAGVDHTATYTGVPLMTLIGNIPLEATIRVAASDGYSMNYPVEMLADRREGSWILAFKENGEYMPFDPGYLRIVLVGENNPHFTSSLSARMVERIVVLGTYEEYTLLLKGAVERTLSRGELEAGIGCPCHTATVTATSKGETHTYTGLPLWRLVAYVDDETYPEADLGIHYNDEDFNDDLAAQDYAITLLAVDEYSRTLRSQLIARDDRFIVAFRRDGLFLDPAKDGYIRFTYDDSVELPEGMRLKPVKFLVKVVLDL